MCGLHNGMVVRDGLPELHVAALDISGKALAIVGVYSRASYSFSNLVVSSTMMSPNLIVVWRSGPSLPKSYIGPWQRTYVERADRTCVGVLPLC